jgi:hypothetical protein
VRSSGDSPFFGPSTSVTLMMIKAFWKDTRQYIAAGDTQVTDPASISHLKDEHQVVQTTLV